MNRRRQSRLLPPVLGVLLLLLVPLLTGCGGPSRPATRGAPSLPPQRLATADRLLARMEESYAAGRDRETLSVAYELIDHYAGYPRQDRVVELAARAAARSGDRTQALTLLGEYLAVHPAGPRAVTLWELRGDLLRQAGDARRAADALLRAHALATAPADRQRLAEALAAVAPDLAADDLAALRADHPSTPLRSYLGYLWLERLLGEGREAEARDAIAVLEGEGPRDDWLARAEQLLHGPGVEIGKRALPRPPAEGADVLHIGVVCPLTGRYTVLGNAFYDGVEAARDRENRLGWRQYTLSVHDSEGDPVVAALATRRLLAEERPIAVVGCLLSRTTVPAALVTAAAGIPLVSPTATNERIAELAPTVFQTNITSAFEARLLARLAVQVLLKRDLAVLHPDTRDGARAAEVFATAVTDLGGRIVAVEAFNTGLTDFREPLSRLVAHLPEAIFVPAGVDQMVLLGPQLDFYRAGALILGISDWNSPRLAREVGMVLDRAVFPSDTALFPPDWVEEFQRDWSAEDQPAEARAIARRSYLATRLLLRTIGDRGCERPDSLAAALAERLADLDRVDPGTAWPRLAAALRMYRDGEIVPFPTSLFTDVLAVADTTAAVAGPVATDQPDTLLGR